MPSTPPPPHADFPGASPAGTLNAHTPLTISELNARVRRHLEGGFPLLTVCGEISNLSAPASGHLYFTLKDEQAQASCIMFRSRAQLSGMRPTAGQRVEARVLVTLYEATGRFQLQVESMRPAGLGDLHTRFIQLKEKLAAEGLFDASRKKPLPSMPRRIGLITSPQAAALRDVVSTLRRRSPQVSLILYPSPVQGEGAASLLIRAIETANARNECELLILCRGGGSLEDLWSFNDEGLARAIRVSRIPVICGVGHEVDFSIADFAADLRAPTPTAAAELAAPEAQALRKKLTDQFRRLRSDVWRSINTRSQTVDLLAKRLRHPGEKIRDARDRLEHLHKRLHRAGRGDLATRLQRLHHAGHRYQLIGTDPADLAQRRRQLEQLRQRLARIQPGIVADRRQHIDAMATQLRQLDPQRIMARGYGMITDTHGRLISDVATVELNDTILVNLRDGRLQAQVQEKNLAARPDSEKNPSD